ncbi:DMT family transporter [Kandeliimicrobium roseum]|uniref:DMT family transporter n=1 Tax=Oceaniglobus roseus TaxID=1737570 RepID=UPI000C7ED853
MLGFCILAPMGDGLAKLIGDRLPLVQLVAARFLLQALILLPLALFAGHGLRQSRRIAMLTALRTALHILGIGAMFLSLRFLPLADAVAIAFVMPFILLLLGRFVLDEEIGPRRIGACVVGFVGTLMVVKPSFAEAGWPALLPLFVALVFSLFMLVTRQIAKRVDPIAMQCTSGLMASAVLLPMLLLAEGTGIVAVDPVMPEGREWVLLAMLGALGTFAHLVMTWSLRFAPAATLAPMQYLEIPFATLIGWLVFHDLPDGLAAAGIGLTVVAGLYIVLRERKISAAPMPPEPKAGRRAAG